ncbi:MAG TPA: nitronate monooxygenase [Intrasporangium sp.]|uniref:nitronate monooxygenase n=1 Tax=Intrasporangium sp. TaxID=1925024 RepID=UPI002D78E53F|nr:nitronate monooxygenase [Intrasporangium sp.]HET7399441.1 nitronate monooxygenase [Intrasporangium sp.]
MTSTTTPVIIQGGMGVDVSSWRLAREVSRRGQLGVVSGTALDAVLARRLQDGDAGGHLRRALAAFPDQAMAERVLGRYFRDGGRPQGAPYRPNPTLTISPTPDAVELAVLGTFAHVWLAKEDHDGPVGINLLEKVQMATPSVLLGAMVAGVDYVLMGAGIPREVPRLLTGLAAGEPVALTVEVHGSTRPRTTTLDPVALLGAHLPPLTRPSFLAVVSLPSLAAYLCRDEATRPDGFVVEGPLAGGHSAPPRGRLVLDEEGQPVYGARDDADLAAIARLGLPFWVAGAYSTPERVAQARAAGAAGVQVGSLFALCEESGLTPALRRRLVEELAAGDLTVLNDPLASPTGFPFKLALLDGTASDEAVYAARSRRCDLSYLRQPYERPDGSVGYRCPGEPVDAYVRKGGTPDETTGRKCLCNALMANVGLGQHRKDGYDEPVAVTLGQDLTGPRRLLAEHPSGWTAGEAVDWLLSALLEPAAAPA